MRVPSEARILDEEKHRLTNLLLISTNKNTPMRDLKPFRRLLDCFMRLLAIENFTFASFVNACVEDHVSDPRDRVFLADQNENMLV